MGTWPSVESNCVMRDDLTLRVGRPKAHLCSWGLYLEGNCSGVDSLAILVSASVQVVFRRAFDPAT